MFVNFAKNSVISSVKCARWFSPTNFYQASPNLKPTSCFGAGQILVRFEERKNFHFTHHNLQDNINLVNLSSLFTKESEFPCDFHSVVNSVLRNLRIPTVPNWIFDRDKFPSIVLIERNKFGQSSAYGAHSALFVIFKLRVNRGNRRGIYSRARILWDKDLEASFCVIFKSLITYQSFGLDG